MLGESTQSGLVPAGAAPRSGPLPALDLDSLLGLGLESGDVLLEFIFVNSPNTASADLESNEIPFAHQRIYLAHRDVEVFGNFVWCEKSRRDRSRHLYVPLTSPVPWAAAST